MSFEHNTIFTKENLDLYLKELAKEFRRMNGAAAPAEIILIGGAAILASYGFRDMTGGIDAIIHAASSIKDAINRVGDRFALPNGWLNADFMHTSSYSPRLEEVSEHYRTYYHAIEIRTVSAEYLIAMKLRAGRKFKNDLSDVLGILAEHQQKGTPISFDRIEQAMVTLYGGWDGVSSETRKMMDGVMMRGHFDDVYASVRQEELQTKDVLLQFERKYPNVVGTSNVDEILDRLKARRK